MRILHVTAQKPDSTGSGVYLNQLVASLSKLGHQQAVVCGVGPEDQPQLPCGVSVFPVIFESEQVPFPVCGMSDVMPYKATRYRDMDQTMVDQFLSAFRQALEKAAGELNPDVIICNHLYLLAAWVRRLFPRVKVVSICHSTCLRQLKSHGLMRDFIKEGICGLDKVFALHAVQKEQIVDLFHIPESQVEVIGTGYDSSTFLVGEAAERPIDLVFVGKISFAKGVASLVRSLELLPEEAGRLSVHLVGGAGSEDEYETICKLAHSSSHDVRLLGKVSQSVLVEEYQGSKVFVLPSFYEGLPLVTIEAMACGCNVVVSDLPGVRPWLEGNISAAPVDYVALPRIEGADTPVQEDLPAFERRLAKAIFASLNRQAYAGNVSHLSWDALAEKVARLSASLLAE